jgi:hypothetical protein
MGEFDAAGELVSGALIGRTVEKRDGEGHDDHGDICLNCGTTLVGPHCHRCGQTGHVHRTIGAIGHDMLHGVLHFEGKLWNTLPLLILRPGELTRRYIHGERAHFVSPMAMFLFSVFTMFAVLQIMGISPPAEFGTPQLAKGMQAARMPTQDRIAQLRAGRARAEPGSARAREFDRQIAVMEGELRKLDEVPVLLGDASTRTVNVNTGWKRLDKGIAKAQANPGLALYKLQTNSYKFSWALIPLSIPFVWLLFLWRREYKGYDHAVFVTYSLAFMSLLFIALTLGGGLGLAGDIIALAAMLIPPLHIFFQLKGAYRLRGWSAALRTIALIWLISWILVIFAALLLGLGLLG